MPNRRGAVDEPGEHAFHGVGQAAGDARRPGDDERSGAAGELAVEDKEGQAAEVVAVEVGDEHGGDLAGVESEALEGAERGGAAVKEHRAGPAGASQVDTGLVAATAAEGVAAASEGDGEGRFVGRGHRPIVLSGPTSGQPALTLVGGRPVHDLKAWWA